AHCAEAVGYQDRDPVSMAILYSENRHETTLIILLFRTTISQNLRAPGNFPSSFSSSSSNWVSGLDYEDEDDDEDDSVAAAPLRVQRGWGRSCRQAKNRRQGAFHFFSSRAFLCAFPFSTLS